MGEFCPALLADTISRAVSNLGSVYGEVAQGTRARSECRGGVLYVLRTLVQGYT